jgi:integrase
VRRADELDALFPVATPDEWVLFQFFLGLGPREQEVMYAHWSDVDFVDGIYKVTAHPSKFKPKHYEEREIPLPDHLVAALRERQREAKSRLIFPTPSGKPDGHMLRNKSAGTTSRVGPNQVRLACFQKNFRNSAPPGRGGRSYDSAAVGALRSGDDPTLPGR